MDDRTLRQLFVLANEFKEGDLAVGGTTDDRIRAEARRQLLATTVGDIRRTSIVDDRVTRGARPLARSAARRLARWAAIGDLTRTLSRRWERRLGRDAQGRAPQRGDRGPRQGHDRRRAVRGGARAVQSPPAAARRRHRRAAALRLAHPAQQPRRRRGGDSVFDPRRAHLRLRRRHHRAQSGGRRSRHHRAPRAAARARRRAARAADPLLRAVGHRASSARRRAHTRVDVGFQSLAGTSKALVGMVGLDVDGLLDVATALRRAVLRNRPGIGGDQRRRRRRRHGDARGARVRPRAPHSASSVAASRG